MKIPLAWFQLFRERIRLLVAIAGIGFVDILMLMQLGFRDALYDSVTMLHQRLDADLLLINPQSKALHTLKRFSRRRLYQLLSQEQVESVAPMYIGGGFWKNPETRDKRIIYMIGFNPARPILNMPDVNQNLEQIKLANVVLFDGKSRSEFGPIKKEFEQDKIIKTELNGHEVTVAGLFTLGTSFAVDGTVIVSDLNFARLGFNRKLDQIDLGLIKLHSDFDPKELKNQLEAQLGNDVKIITKQEFIQLEKQYWAKSTPIGFIFNVGTAMGFVVGVVIVYQILYSDVSEHLPEYATLKAMGYTDRYLLILVFQQAIILALLGYLPGFGISFGLYTLTKAGTNLPLIMELSRSITVLILTIVMCFMSGAIAVRRLKDADPADIF